VRVHDFSEVTKINPQLAFREWGTKIIFADGLSFWFVSLMLS